MTGPPSNNSKPPDYLRIIGNDTDTECSLQGRSIKIVGNCEETIKEALERFRNLQTIFKRRKRPTIVVPCVHYPTDSPKFTLYFCPLERYAQQEYVALGDVSPPVFVILPVFKDNRGQDMKPTDLLTNPTPQAPQWMMQKKQQQQQQKEEQELSLEERMRLASLEHKKKGFGNVNAGMAPDQTPLWGENKNYVVRPSESAVQKQVRSTPPPVIVQKTPEEEFPSLGGPVHARPTVQKAQKNTRRVLRVVPQKSGRVARNTPPPMSNMDM